MSNNPPQSFNVKYSGLVSELKTQVHISKAFDPSKTIPSSLQFQKFIAIWDTGATCSVISEEVVTQCGLQPISMSRVKTANGTRNSKVYLVSVLLPNQVGYHNVRVTECPLTEGADVLIGMDIINTGDFAVTNKNKQTNFSFRHPSIEHIDFVKENQTSSPISRPIPKIGRNTPCPCKSGKKYKKCCGRNI